MIVAPAKKEWPPNLALHVPQGQSALPVAFNQRLCRRRRGVTRQPAIPKMRKVRRKRHDRILAAPAFAAFEVGSCQLIDDLMVHFERAGFELGLE